ncbi:DNA excision repair protein ERCC-8 [Actinomortierella ambigua]|nr:DNA excision repair protein ERCC-8 [Actinomortierella ambigua]
MRLWDTFTGRNTLVNYGTWIRNQFVHNVSPLVTPITTCPYPNVFYPSDDRSILMFNLMDGSLMKRLTGAYGRITALTWRPRSEEIYTAGNDHTILAWGPRNKQRESLQQTLAEQDTWSDSDEEESW